MQHKYLLCICGGIGGRFSDYKCSRKRKDPHPRRVFVDPLLVAKLRNASHADPRFRSLLGGVALDFLWPINLGSEISPSRTQSIRAHLMDLGVGLAGVPEKGVLYAGSTWVHAGHSILKNLMSANCPHWEC